MDKKIVFLYHHENCEGIPPRVEADRYCALFGYYLRLIDFVGDLLAVTNDVYSTLQEALDDPRFEDWTWVFIDSKATDKLEDFQHPEDKVVYVFGADTDGFARHGKPLKGPRLLVSNAYPDGYEHYAVTCIPVVATHRFYQVDIK